MGFKTILVPLDGGDLNDAVLETALAAAQRFQAHIEVLHVRSSPQELVPKTFGLSDSLRKTIAEAAERAALEQTSEVRAAFEKFCRDHGLTITDKPSASTKATAAWREETGHGWDVIRRGRLSDLIFIPRPGKSSPSTQTFETALLDTGRPVVLVPPKPHQCVASHVTIGWNASAEAARAVAAAMPCIAGADSVTVLASQKRTADAKELTGYLAWHGIKPAVKIFDAGPRSVGETLLAESRELGADLLVIGGYTRTRARQLLFGGVTHHVREAADIPVMMVH